LGDCLWGTDNDTLDIIISRLIRARGLSIAVAESFTGGFLSFSLSGAPDSPRFFKGGLIVLDTGTRASLQIDPVSMEKADIHSASCMAEIAQTKFSADIGIGIDGYLKSEGILTTDTAFIAINLKQNNFNLARTYSK
jgi:nicotinamide-nucleotide amidase